MCMPVFFVCVCVLCAQAHACESQLVFSHHMGHSNGTQVLILVALPLTAGPYCWEENPYRGEGQGCIYYYCCYYYHYISEKKRFILAYNSTLLSIPTGKLK